MANAFTSKVKAVWAFIKRTAARVLAYLKVAKMEWIILISVFIVDLVAKSLVENFLEWDQSVPMIPYVLNAHKVHNYAAAFGASFIKDWIGDIGARIFFCVFAVAVSVAFVLFMIKNKGKSRILRISLALFVAGAMGNCIDRMVLGYVRDFIEFVYFGLTIGGRTTWPYIFNIADMALVSGVVLIVIYFFFLYKDPDKKKKNEEQLSVEQSAAQLGDTENSDTAEVADTADESVTDNETSIVGDDVQAAEEHGNVEPAVRSDDRSEPKDSVIDISDGGSKTDTIEDGGGGPI